MGLFRKSPAKANPTEIEVLQSQFDALLRRVETAEVDQTRLGARVVALDDITTDLAGGRNAAEHFGTASGAGTGAASGDGSRLDKLTGRFDSVAAIGGQLDELGRQLAQIQQRTLEVQQHADERHAALRAEVDELRSASPIELDRRLEKLDERLAESDADAAEAATRHAALDERLTNVSTELANQIAELGGDIDALAGLPGKAAVDDEHADGDGAQRFDALATGQTKLANEQARYEIAFREDLAALAEQIRRSSGR